MKLPRTGLIAECAPDLFETFDRIATEVWLRTGDVLFEQYDDGDALFAVVSGALEISVLSIEGRKLALDVLKPGALLGEIALFDPGERTATATALEHSLLLRIRNGDLLREIGKKPELAIAMLGLAGERMRAMNAQLSDQVFLPMPVRLARRVIHLLDAEGEGATVRMSQAALADFMGTTREAVAKTIADWRRLGLVTPGRGKLTVLDREALEALADGHGE